MGGFYGSIHFRNIDRVALLRETEKLARTGDHKFLVGPEINGWTAVYPDQHGQDHTIGAELAKGLDASALHLLVHDDDIFAYGFYRGSKLVDRYNSCPDYFGGVSTAKKAQLRGNIESLREFVGPGPDLDEAKALIHRGHSSDTFEVERLTKFADILGIPNAVTSYEYLLDGERDHIIGWEDFVPVPDDRAQKQAAASMRKNALVLLKREGLLLGEFKPDQTRASGWIGSRVWCLDPVEDRVWLTVCDGLPEPEHTVPLLSWSPGQDRPSVTEWQLPATVHSLQFSPTGRWLVVGNAYGNWTAELWDPHTYRRQLIVPHEHAVELCVFLCAETRLLLSGSGAMTMVTIPDGTPLPLGTGEPRAFGRGVAVHPSGRWIVASRPGGAFEVLDAHTGETVKEITTHKGMAHDLAAIPAMMQNLLASGMSPRELQSSIARMANPETFTTFVFSRNGEWLCTGSTLGLRVYGWSDLLATVDGDAPVPVHSVDARSNETKSLGTYCYTVVVDDAAHRVLFAGLEGTVEALDLVTGKVTTLLDPPERLAIVRMELSTTRNLLVISAKEFVPNSKRSLELTAWSYPRLCEEVKLTKGRFPAST